MWFLLIEFGLKGFFVTGFRALKGQLPFYILHPLWNFITFFCSFIFQVNNSIIMMNSKHFEVRRIRDQVPKKKRDFVNAINPNDPDKQLYMLILIIKSMKDLIRTMFLICLSQDYIIWSSRRGICLWSTKGGQWKRSGFTW